MKRRTLGWLGLVVGGVSLMATVNAAAETAMDLGDIVITASRMAQYDYQTTADVTVIGRRQIADSSARTINEVLESLAGVYVYDNSTAKTSVVDIRGFGDTASRNVLVLVNDRKVNVMDISAPDLLQIPLESVERIEVLRGAGSVLYGDNAVGGVVNIITKEGAGDFAGRVGYTHGSYHARGEDLEISGQEGRASYYLYSKYFDSRGYRANSDLLTKDFNTRLGYDLTEQMQIRVDASWHEDDAGLPGGLSESELATLGRQGSADPEDYSSTKDRFVQLSLDMAPWQGGQEWGHVVVDYSYRNRDGYDSFNTYGAFNTKRSIDTNGLAAKYIFDRTLLGREVNFVTGVDVYDSENDILGSDGNVDDITISKLEMGGYGHLEAELVEDVFLNGGLRYTRARYDFTQRNVIVDATKSPDEWVYMGGVKYEYAPGSNVFGNVQKTFRFLATDEWYSTANYPAWGITPGLNLDLEQQTGMQYELGVKHNLDNKVTLTATTYVIDNKNEIFFDPVSFANSNYDKTQRVGLELGQRADLLKFWEAKRLRSWEVFVNYAYQNAEFKGGANHGQKIPMVPTYQVSAGTDVGLGERWRVSCVGRYVGSRFAVNDVANETAAVKPYVVVDSKLVYAFAPWELFLSVNNIFNEKYETYVSKSTSSTDKDYFPAPERNVTFGASVRF